MDDKFDKLKNTLYRAVTNISQSFYDDYVEANARFRAKSGRKVFIVRRQLGRCCGWCANLSGIYKIDDAPDDIYKRHDNCKCLVTVKTEKGWQDAWSKKEFASQREARIERNKEIESEQRWKKDLFSKTHPINSFTNEKYVDHDMVILKKQFGKKVRTHAKDFGLSPKSENDREKFRNIIIDIQSNPDERVYGEFREQEKPVVFHIKGENVVVESKYNEFITILRGGINNERVKRARRTRI